MTKDNQLSRNIRSLRKAFGETQDDLAGVLGLSGRSAISNFESGRNELDSEKASKLAAHFLISTEELLKSDLSNCPRFDPNPEVINQSLFYCFPIITSDDAMKNLSFRKGVEAHRALFDCCISRSMDTDKASNLLAKAMNYYIDSPASYEALSNILAIWCILHTMSFVAPYFISDTTDTMVAPLKMLKESDDHLNQTIKNYLAERDDEPDGEKGLTDYELTACDPEIQEWQLDTLACLKESEQYRDVADYYLAILFILGMIQNGLSYELNRRIGLEMMWAFAKTGNRMAILFQKYRQDAWSPKKRNKSEM